MSKHSAGLSPSGRSAGRRIRIRRRTSILLTLALLLSVVPLGALPAGAEGAPWIASDLDDYPPGGLVTLTGGNWQPGETVRIVVDDDQDFTWQRDVTVLADVNGELVDQFNLPNWFVATYSVVATGEASGTAASSFTDGNVRFLTNGPTLSDISWETFQSTDCTGTARTGPNDSGTDDITSIDNSTDTLTVGINQNQSAKLTVPAVVGQQDFVNWTGESPFSTSGTGGRTICVTGWSGATVQRVTANYAAAVRVTETAVESSNSPSVYGDEVTFTATVTATGGDPSGVGTVTFMRGSDVLCDDVALVGNLATCAIDSLSAVASPHSITASYSGATTGSPQFEASTSAPLAQDVDPLNVTGSFTAADKTYDGATTASITGRSLSGAVQGDLVELSGGTAAFADKNVGDDKTVAGTGFGLVGDDAGNYTLGSVATTTAEITALGLTVTATGENKVYDGLTDATVTLSTDKLDTDDVTAEHGGAAFANANVGTDITINVAGITIGGADAANYDLLSTTATTSANITVKELTGHFTVENKIYDGSVSASISSRSVSGDLEGDDVSLSGGTASFGNKNVGDAKAVAGTGFSLVGGDAGNYSLASSELKTNADITPADLTVTATGADKEYDGTTDATVDLTDDRIASDELTTSYTSADFDDRHVGTDKTVSVAGISISGDDAGNYTLTNTTAGTTANVTARAITVTAATDAKVYDGTTSSAGVPTITDGELADSDSATWSQTFDTKNVGNSKTLTPAGVVVDGNSGDNYDVTFETDETGEITPLAIAGSFTSDNKEYDGNTAATVLTRTLTGHISGDDVSLSGGTATFDDKNVGDGKTVTLTGAALVGDDATNYSLTSVDTNTADITARDLTVTATGVDKVYDGTTSATVDLSTDKVAGDDVTAAYTTASFNDRHVANGKPVDVSGISISGTDAGNYNLTSTSASTTADITSRQVAGSFTAADKVYDGTTATTITGRSLSNAIAGDDVSLIDGTANFGNASVGTHKTVTGTGFSITGSDVHNYTLASSTLTTTASILAWDADGHGFFQPVGVSSSIFVTAPDPAPAASEATVWNVAKGGSTIPLKFQVFAAGVEKTNTSDISAFTQTKLSSCGAAAAGEVDEALLTTGNTSLRYTDGQWIQNWKTPPVKKGAEECWRATVRFSDGSTLSAFFKLR